MPDDAMIAEAETRFADWDECMAAMAGKYDEETAAKVCATICAKKTAEAQAAREDYPWDQCIADQMEKYGDEETAKKVCGMIKATYGKAMPPDLESARKEAEVALGLEVARVGILPQARHLRAYVDRATMPKEPGAPMRFVASTEDIARDGGIIMAEGWQLDAYRENPVFLWAHDYTTLPLGKTMVSVDGGRLIADVIFDQADEFARQVEGKYQRGFLNAVSVGWNTLEYADARALPEGAAWMSLKHELLDVSAVPVPADPGALAERQRRALTQLGQQLAQLGDSQPQSEGEPDWQEVAAAMVAVLSPGGDDPDAVRLERYNALLPKYRRLGKTAPEFLDAATVSALGLAERRGLFLAGEPDLLPLEFAEPGISEPDSMGLMLEGIQARLTALEARAVQPPAKPDARVLESILTKLASLGVRVVAAKPEPVKGQGPKDGDDGKSGQRDAKASETDTILQGILEKLESR